MNPFAGTGAKAPAEILCTHAELHAAALVASSVPGLSPFPSYITATVRSCALSAPQNPFHLNVIAPSIVDADLDVPAGQEVHAAFPVENLYLPAPQGTQLLDESRTCPALQTHRSNSGNELDDFSPTSLEPHANTHSCVEGSTCLLASMHPPHALLAPPAALPRSEHHRHWPDTYMELCRHASAGAMHARFH